MKYPYKTLLSASLLSLSLGAQADTIDLFSTSQGGDFGYIDNTEDINDTGTIITSGVGGSVGANDPTILGGNRDIYVSKIRDGDNDNILSRNATAIVVAGQFSFSTTSQTGGRAQIQWDGAEATENIDHTGLGNYDLTQGGTVNSFALRIIESDAGFNFAVSIYTNESDWTKVIISANEHLDPITTHIPFSAFTLDTGLYLGGTVEVIQNGNGATLTDIGALVADIDQLGLKTNLDLTLDSVTTVPEPSVLALMGLGLIGFASTRRNLKAS